MDCFRKTIQSFTCRNIWLVNKFYNTYFEIDVFSDLPRVSVSPASLIILEGINNATLTCNATGIPSPVITWSLIAGASILSQSAVLNLFNISRPGTPTEELHYQCTASNGIGNPAIDNVTITVHCKYRVPVLACQKCKRVASSNWEDVSSHKKKSCLKRQDPYAYTVCS